MRRWAWLWAVAVVALVAGIMVAGRASDSGQDGKRGAAGGPGAGASRSPGAATIETLRRRVSGPHDNPVPILMYHAITEPVAGAPYPELYVRAAGFRAQMRDLARRGYHGVTLRQAYDYWHEGFALPRKPVVISFDDGYQSDYRNALPVLRALHWPGTLNLAVKNEKPSWGLSREKVRGLIAAGWEVDSHTISHLDVSTLDSAALEHEIAGSRQILRRQFKVPVDFFCYPSGRFNDAAIGVVKRAGYLGATTTELGLASPEQPFTLARVRINGSDGPSAPAEKIAALAG